MSSPHPQAPMAGGYDQSLLAAAPVASKAAKQEGYNVDLLDEGRHRSAPPARTADLEAAHGGSKENFRSPVERGPAAAPRKVPFWRTRRGIIGLSILAVIIVGAVVGGAVGGSVGKKNNDSTALPASSSATESTQTVGGTQGQASASSVTTSQTTPGQETKPTSAASLGGLGGQPDTSTNPDSAKSSATTTTPTNGIAATAPTP